MKILYVHIGMPKTGTTAIQNFCYENQKVLNKRGYDYPMFPHIYGDTVGRARNGHFLVPAEHAANGQVFRDNIDAILKKFQMYPSIILSDEAIWAPASKCKNMWNALKEESVKGGFQVKIIVYLRRQDAYLSSIWNQFVKGKGEKQAWADYVQDPKRAGKMNYGTNLKLLMSIWGKEALIVRRFEPKRFIGESIYADFLNAVGLQMTEEYTVSQYVRNTKLGGNTHEIMRVINGMPGLEYDDLQYFKRILLSYAELSAAEYPAEMFAKEEAQEFMEKYRGQNQKVSDLFFEGEELFDLQWKDTIKWDKNNPHMQDDMIRFVVLCCKDIMEQNRKLSSEVEKLKNGVNRLNHPIRMLRRKKKGGKVKKTQ